MPDLAAAYREAREDLSALARNATPDELAAVAPATPDWNVKDIVAHVASIADAFSAGGGLADVNVTMMWDPAVTDLREAWVNEQVELSRERSIEEIVSAWDASGEALEAMMRGDRPYPEGLAIPFPDWVVTTDLGVHLHDAYGALGRVGPRDSVATKIGARSYIAGMDLRAQMEGRPALRIRAGAKEWTVGQGEPVATVTADLFELARALSGRRSPEQIRAFDWDGDPGPFLDLFYPYGPREAALVE